MGRIEHMLRIPTPGSAMDPVWVSSKSTLNQDVGAGALFGRGFQEAQGASGERESGKREKSIIRCVVVSGLQLWAAGPTSCGDSRRADTQLRTVPLGAGELAHAAPGEVANE